MEEMKEDLTTRPTLGYSNSRGAAAPIRNMLHHLKIDFEDKPHETEDREEEEKESPELPNLPYLIDGEVKLTEPVHIMQYIARKYQPALLGSSAAEFAKTLMLSDKVAALKEKAETTSGDPEATVAECRPLLT